MAIEPLFDLLSPVEIVLDQLFLDPNNPRFTVSDWNYVPKDAWENEDVQEEAIRRLVKGFDVEKLKMSMEVNGFLPIDRVIVREFLPGKFVVLEGNRRIAAAKLIKRDAKNGIAISPQILSSLESIPCLQYTGADSEAAWVFQGLRHISGVVEWSAYNKAKLLVEQMEQSGLSLTEVGKRFGLTPHGAGQWVRGYRAFEQARQASDYIAEVDERSYPYFQELFGRSSAAIREWLEWNEEKQQFANKLNFDEFISWLYPRPSAGSAEGENQKGNFESRRIARRDDLRQIADLRTKHVDLFNQYRAGAQLEQVYSLGLAREYEEAAKKASNPVADLFDAVDACIKAINNIPFKAMKEADSKAQILLALENLRKAIADFS